LSQDHPIIRVKHADALTYRADLLVLKYAQTLYGVDEAVVRRLGLEQGRLPAIYRHTLVRQADIATEEILFLGVPPLARFAYREIREFAFRAMSVAATTCPEAREICLTLHGPGYGLDETEAFESELAGIDEAISKKSFPSGLRFVTFVELDAARAERMSTILDALFPDSRLDVDRRTRVDSGGDTERLRSAGYDAAAKGHAFIAMPFADSFQDIFHYAITPVVRQAGLLCERMDELTFTGDIVHRMKQRIGAARIVVADLTGANPNVYLEVGYAWGCDIPTVLICDQSTELKFDVRGQRCLIYRSIRDLEQQLTKEIAALLRANQ
jgi:hypothetical protein